MEIILKILEGVVTPILVCWIAYIYSQQRKENAQKAQEQEERDNAKRELDLCIARIMLLENYEKCVDKGYYSLNERQVYHPLFENYHKMGGDGVIDVIMEKLLELPTEKEE